MDRQIRQKARGDRGPAMGLVGVEAKRAVEAVAEAVVKVEEVVEEVAEAEEV